MSKLATERIDIKKQVSKKNHNDEEKSIQNKVTDIKDVQKAAQKNEKERKKIERKEYIEEKVSELNIHKIKIIATLVAIVVIFSVFIGSTIIKEVQIDQGKHYSKKQIKGFIIQNILDYNSVYLFLKHRYTEQENIPFVEYIDVQWVDRNTIKLKVYDKNIIGCTNFMNEYVYFDKDGYVVETSSKKEDNIQYITGMKFEQLSLNRKIDIEDEEIFETILYMTQQIKQYKLKDIDEISFDKEYNISLYSGDIVILLGKHKTYDEQLAELAGVLPEAKKENLKGVFHMENYKEGQERIIFDKID